jgi:hypothetical protein
MDHGKGQAATRRRTFVLLVPSVLTLQHGRGQASDSAFFPLFFSIHRVRRHSVLPSSIPFICLRGVLSDPPLRCDSTSPFFHEATDQTETKKFFAIQFDLSESHSFNSLAQFSSRSLPVTWPNGISGTGLTSSIV